jgi:hypothetical protein
MALKQVDKTEKKDLNVGVLEGQNQGLSNVEFSEEEKTEGLDFKTEEIEVSNIETEGSPMEMMRKMLEEQERKLTANFEKRLQEEKRKNESLAVGKKELDEDSKKGEELLSDWLENPVTFFSYVVNYSLMGDMRRGKESLPPNGAIKFSPLVRSKRKDGRGVVVTSICAVKSNSRAEVEYLRTSPLFGITFHESVDGATKVDASLAQILISSNQEVQRLNDHDVVNKCTAYGIKLSTDIDLMRRRLTDHLAKQKKAQMDVYYDKQKVDMEKMVINEDTGNLAHIIDKNV